MDIQVSLVPSLFPNVIPAVAVAVVLLLLLLLYKENLNASRPSEHPLDRGGKVLKRIGGIIDCKDKLFLTFSVLVDNSKKLF